VKQYLILEDIRSAYNVGAMFRTADGAGVQKVFLCGYTPKPIDRFGRVQNEIKKTSLGASETIEWEACDDIETLVKQLQSEQIEVVAVEQGPGAKSVADFAPGPAVAYILGNEVTGVSMTASSAADEIVYIPMLGEKESLNVATAAGIMLYHGLV